VKNSLDASVMPLQLPPFEDANSIQIALMQVVDAILHNRLDNKRSGLVLYALQTASSNLANGADFQPMAGATVAGGYDDFEADFELGDDVPELRADEAEEPESDEETGNGAQIQDIAEACAKLEAAKNEAEGSSSRFQEKEDGSQVFHCDPVNGFFCSFMGPLSRACAPGAEPAPRLEREAASQKLEMLSVSALAKWDDGLHQEELAA